MPAPAILVEHLSREFTTHVKRPGLGGAIRGLFKREYVSKMAVEDLNFAIQPGGFVGFLGPNGAGKTTTLKMLAGVLHPTAGTATVLGHVPWRREAAFQRRFSLVLGQKNQLWWDLPAYDSFVLNRDIYEIPPAAFDAKVKELSELLELDELLHVPLRKLSLGERMKCELAGSLLHSPEVLFLDEPTIGLDLVSQGRIREFLREYNRQTGITVLLTSHYMGDIEALCRRVMVIAGGKAVFDGPLPELVSRFADEKRIQLTLRHDAGETERAIAAGLGTEVEIEGPRLTLSVPMDQVPDRVTKLLAGLPVQDLAVEDVDIEHVIRELFAETKTS